MFKVEKVSDNRVHIEISGKITAEEMRVGIDDLIASSDQITNGSMRCLIHDFDLPSLGAFAVELSRLPSLFGLVRKYDRTAVITDKEWVRKAPLQTRSEEHTSELQSRPHLVCRLLLEKKHE